MAPGIVHLGVGARLRAGIAWYTDAALNCGSRNWAITAVSLRSPIVARRLASQDGLYAFGEQSDHGISLRVVGAINQVLIASEAPRDVIAAIAAPATRIVSFTVTSAGYCNAANGSLDFERAHSHSLYYFTAQGMLRRRSAGLPGLTLLSCDDIPDNGTLLQALIRAYLDVHEPSLVEWFLNECSCPNSTGHRVILATDHSGGDALTQQFYGLCDLASVMTEHGRHWVIEDNFVQGRPDWSYGGAEFVSKLEPAKPQVVMPQLALA